MASTFDAAHPTNLIEVTDECIVEQTVAHAYDELSSRDGKSQIAEKNGSSTDVEVVAVERFGGGHAGS
jgi:hypothetical protein